MRSFSGLSPSWELSRAEFDIVMGQAFSCVLGDVRLRVYAYGRAVYYGLEREKGRSFPYALVFGVKEALVLFLVSVMDGTVGSVLSQRF